MASLQTIILIFTAGVVAFTLYILAQEFRKPKHELEVGGKEAPLFITREGYQILDDAKPVGKDQYRFKFKSGYQATYTVGENKSDFVQFDNAQQIIGSNRPLYLEKDVVLTLAYGHEDKQTRKMLRQALAQIIQTVEINKIDPETIEPSIKKLSAIANKLLERPKLEGEVKHELGEARKTAERREGLLRRQQSSEDGRIRRRNREYAEVAAALSGRNREERRTNN